MSLKFDELPRVAQERINEIIKEYGITQEEVMEKYKEVYNLDFIAASPTEAFRHVWASQKLHSDFLIRPPLKKHNIVPVGVDGVNKFGDAEPYQDFFAYNIDMDKLISMRADKKSLKLVKQLVLGEYYENFSASISDQGRFYIDDRVELPEPSPYIGIEVEEGEEEYPKSIDQLLSENLNIRQIQMKDFGNSELTSKRTNPRSGGDGKTYVISTDWVCVRNCIVISNRKFPVKGLDGVFKGQLTVTDNSVTQDITTDRGIIIPNRMPVWVAGRHLYPTSSVLNLWGTVEHRTFTQTDPNDRSKEIERQNFQMNAYYVFPLGVGPKEIE